MHKLEEEAQWLETEGWGKFREAVVGSEAEGFYGPLRGVTLYSCLLLSQPLLQRSCLVPSSSISQPPPQEFTGPEASDPAGQATVSLPLQLQRGTYQPICNPSESNWGALSEYISARLKVAKRGHQPHRPPSVPMCKRYTWE